MIETLNLPGGVTLHHGHALEILRSLPCGIVHCCVTSPPYFGLRRYGAGRESWPAMKYAPLSGLPSLFVPAMSVELGAEATIEAYIGHLVLIFREVRRVLRKEGTLWLNLGDSYANDGKWGGHSGGKHAKVLHCSSIGRNKRYTNLKPKDLIMIPHRVALALQADGWFVRMDNVWHKPNPLPESVTDRPTKAHEYVFLLAKTERYAYDAHAIAEPSGGWRGSSFTDERDLLVRPRTSRKPRSGNKKRTYGDDRGRPNSHLGASVPWEGECRRPQRLRAEQLAREGGLTEAHIEAVRAVGLCDAGQAQITQTGFNQNSPEVMALFKEAKAVLGGYTREFLMSETRNARSVWNIPVRPYQGAHFAVFPSELPRRCVLAGCPPDGVVLDPFAGSGTTGEVARELGRRAILLELQSDYIDIIRTRLNADQLTISDC